MKLTTTINIAEYALLPWPENIPLPNIGDTILFMTPGGSRAGKLDRRTFGIGTDPKTGQPAATLSLQVSGKKSKKKKKA